MTEPSALERAFAAGDARAVAVARARAFALFARFVRRGVEPETLEHARGLEELASAAGLGSEGFDADAAAAEHQRVFGFEVPPLASVFLEPDGVAGGEVTERAHRRLLEAGVPIRATDESADHLAVQLDGLAFLSAAEADAWRDEKTDAARSTQAHAAALASQVKAFLPELREAVAAEAAAFHEALLGLVEALVEGAPSLPPAPAPALTEVLDNPEAGLAAVARHLLACARAGLHLSRGAIARAGREAGLPTGFGTREDRLLTLLRGAAENDRFPEATGALLERVGRARAFHAARGRADPQVEARLEATREGLERLRTAAR